MKKVYATRVDNVCRAKESSFAEQSRDGPSCTATHICPLAYRWCALDDSQSTKQPREFSIDNHEKHVVSDEFVIKKKKEKINNKTKEKIKKKKEREILQ